MQQPEPSYDIHEKIAQLETELLQHELLIRRQKHVISSLKTMITSPQRAWNNSDEPTMPSIVRNSVSLAAPIARINSASSRGAPVPPQVSVPPTASTNNAVVQRKKGNVTSAVAERPINMHKKKSAIRKVFQYCATVLPKYGAAAAPKRKRSVVNVVEEGDGSASKRSRISNNPGDAIAAQRTSGSNSTSNSSSSGSGSGSGRGSSSSSGQRRTSHSSVAALSAEEEEAEDLADEEAFLATAGAKLSYLNAMRAQNRSALNNTGNTSSNSAAQQRVSPRPVMVPVQLRPTVSSSSALTSSQQASVRGTLTTNSTSKGGDKTSNNSSNGNSSNSSSSNNKVKTSTTSTASVQRPVPVVTNLSTNKSTITSAVKATPTPSSTKQTTTTATNLHTTNAISTPIINKNPPFSSSASVTSPITSPRNLLTGSTHKNKTIFEYCQQVRSLEEKLEVTKDMHSYILSNPRRLQQFLDSTGGRDLFLSWLTEGMDRIQAGDLRADEELAQTKLMEYTVLLINQAYWNAKSVSELKFDKTLKALYRLFEDRRGPHHVTVSNIVKGIWPSYRIMRKQHEASKSGKSNNNVFVVD